MQDEKIYIEVSQKRLAQLGLDFNQVLAQLARRTRSRAPARSSRRSDVVQVRVGGQFTSVEQLRAMPIRGSSGAQLRLGDIADVQRGYIDPPGRQGAPPGQAR